jgi:hypothetical protein
MRFCVESQNCYYVAALFSLAHDYEMSGQIQKATEICEEALKMETEDPQPLDLNWADCMYV